jgi:4-hydroxy-2-oxoheptanedioate aldolase
LFRSRERIVATFVMIPRVEVIEMLAVAGFDAVVMDLEHGPMGIAEMVPLASAADGAGLLSIARLGDGSPLSIGSALDAGFDGVMVPHVSSGVEAVGAVRAARLPPEGSRSLNPYARGNRYGAIEPSALDAVNARAAVIGMVEGEGAIDELDGILASPGLDAVFVGPVDLSGAMGLPGQIDHPRVVAEIESIFSRSSEAGVAAGVYASTPESANRWFEAGAILVAVSADIAMSVEAFKSVREGVIAGRVLPGVP